MAATVSILTVTQYSRRECMLVLADLIQRQLYKTIAEWVIVEGSQTQAEATANEAYLFSQREMQTLPFNINYIPYNPFLGSQPRYLSELRNSGNNACRGDIIVCMDDDDYYPPTRISHAVDRLTSSSSDVLIAGCSRVYIYFYLTRTFFQSKGFGQGHSTNNCLAYKRAYLETHAHEHALTRGEEPSFTNNFTEPMVQLDPLKTIVISGHGHNTVDKEPICHSASSRFTELIADTITDYIPLPILLKLEDIFDRMQMIKKLKCFSFN